jgi:type I restriction enzyme S subunit
VSSTQTESQTVRLKHVASVAVSNVDKKSADGERAVRLCNYTDVYYNANIMADLAFMEATATDAQIKQFTLRSGDVIITKDSETPDDIAVPAFIKETLDNVVCGYHLAVIRPHSQHLHPKFLYWTLASTALRAKFGSEATGVTRFGLRTDSIANALIRVPDQGTQRRLTAFLDTETARIDALIEKKRLMIQLQLDRLRSLSDEVLWSATDREIPLKHCVGPTRPIMYGIVLPGPDVSVGVPIVKGGDVVEHRLRLDMLCRTTKEIESHYERSRLRPSDIVFAIRGGIGEAGLVPPELEGANITQDVARISPGERIDSYWLLLVLRSHRFQQRATSWVTGATIRGLNIGDLDRLRIPDSNRRRQEADLLVLRPEVERVETLTETLRRQIELLVEYRQTLVTAAVTGELDLVVAR